MKTSAGSLLLLVIAMLMAVPASAAVLLDDRWEDGDRTDTNLPEEAAWYGSTVTNASTLSASVGSLNGLVQFGVNTSSRLWITHFTPAGSPVELALGDTLKVTLVFAASNVTASSTSRGLRFGLFNFSEPDAARVSADGFSTGSGGGAPGTNVTGYLLNMNFGQTLSGSPLQLMKRTDLATNNLMGALAVFTSFGTGGGQGGEGFQNETPYTLEFVVRRFQTSAEITATLSDTNGWRISHAVLDNTNPNSRFDGFAIRPNSVADTAQTFIFKQFKVEHVPFQVRITSFRLTPPFNDATITFSTLPGESYQVEWRPDLASGTDWEALGSAVAGDGAAAVVEDSDAGFETQRFYRVVQLP